MKKLLFIGVFVFVSCKTSQFDYNKLNRIELPASIQETSMQDILRMEASRNQKIIVYDSNLYTLKSFDSIAKSLGSAILVAIKTDSISGKRLIFVTKKSH